MIDYISKKYNAMLSLALKKLNAMFSYDIT